MFKKFLELQHNEETSRVGNKWLPEEDYKLLKEITDKKSFEDIALEHKRTIVGIKARVISHILYAQYKDGIKTIDELSYEYNIEKNLVEKYIRTINNNNAIIVPFLNGLSHFDILKKKFKKNLYYSNIGKIISIKKSAKKILHLSKNKPEILISSENKNNNKIRIICNIFKKINFNVKVINSNTKVIWTKLIRLSSISAITAIYNCNLGEIKKSKKKWSN